MALKKLYKKFDPNPGDFSKEFHTPTDCVIRTCTLLFNIPWEWAFYIASKLAMKNYCMPNDFENIIDINALFDCKCIFEEDDENYKHNMTVYSFAKNHPKGKYFLLAQEHAVACINGKFIDSWNSRWEHIEYVFKVPSQKKIKKVIEELKANNIEENVKNFQNKFLI